VSPLQFVRFGFLAAILLVAAWCLSVNALNLAQYASRFLSETDRSARIARWQLEYRAVPTSNGLQLPAASARLVGTAQDWDTLYATK